MPPLVVDFRRSKQTARYSYNMKEVSTRGSPGAILPLCALAAAAFLTMTAPRSEGAAADADRGRDLLAQYQCGACHEIPGVRNARGRVGPTLAAFSSRAYIAGEVPVSAATLAAWLVDPRSLVPETPMPAMGVSRKDAAAMAAYLLTLH